MRCELVSSVVVALPPDLAARPPDYLRGGAKPLQIVSGGDRRQDSVANAFAAIADRADIVVIHDAARPLVTDAIIRRTVEAAVESGAAIAAIRVSDTVKRGDAAQRIIETLPRDRIYLAQTPQAFRTSVLRDALGLADDATDEAALAERAGYAVRLVEGASRNLKITTAEDLAMAEHLLGGATPGSTLRRRIGRPASVSSCFGRAPPKRTPRPPAAMIADTCGARRSRSYSAVFALVSANPSAIFDLSLAI